MQTYRTAGDIKWEGKGGSPGGCSADPTSVFDCQFPTSLTGTHENFCTGGGRFWVDIFKVLYLDGEYASADGGNGLESDQGYQCLVPVGTSASVAIAYEQETDDGDWAPWNPSYCNRQ